MTHEVDKEACREAASILKVSLGDWDMLPPFNDYWRQVFRNLCNEANISTEISGDRQRWDSERVRYCAQVITEAFPFHSSIRGAEYWDKVVLNLRYLSRIKV